VKAPVNQPTKSQEHQMNRFDQCSAPKNSPAYMAAQSAMQPIVETLQVDESLNTLREVVEYHIEIVEALLRRIEPATGELGVSEESCLVGIAKVPLALRVDNQRDRIARLTDLVQTAIRQLQI
jgi:hypothetical protein